MGDRFHAAFSSPISVYSAYFRSHFLTLQHRKNENSNGWRIKNWKHSRWRSIIPTFTLSDRWIELWNGCHSAAYQMSLSAALVMFVGGCIHKTAEFTFPNLIDFREVSIRTSPQMSASHNQTPKIPTRSHTWEYSLRRRRAPSNEFVRLRVSTCVFIRHKCLF